jgi:phosphopantothenoylcysteine decarboxylase/phosphopantothenate--cysteine ligase
MSGEPRDTVVLGVSSSVSAYKACEILRLLQEAGLEVRVAMTRNAARLVSPRLMSALAGNEAWTDLWDDPAPHRIAHIELAEAADALLVAPATANLVAKFAAGLADDLLSALYLSAACPVAVAPAMNEKMYRHPRTRANLARLEADGVTLIPPDSGYLACGEKGPGRLAPPERIVEETLALLKGPGSLKGRKVLVTAGPTREFLDPVRFLTSRSSGRMGFELAREALRRGADVTLVAGPTTMLPPRGVEFLPVVSAGDMRRAVLDVFPGVEIVVMAAAVSDYAFERTAPEKLKKNAEADIRLARTPDILEELGRNKGSHYLVGFAAETGSVEKPAMEKIAAKNLDLIVANDVSRSGIGFDSPDNQVLILDRSGKRRETEIVGKRDISRKIWDEIEAGLERARG